MKTKIIRILEEDYKILKEYSKITHVPMCYVVKRAFKRYFEKRKTILNKE